MTDVTKSEYLKLVRQVEQLADAYYNQDEPLVSDYEYDQLTQQLKAIETAHPDWLSPDSLTHKIGGQATVGNKVRHLTRLTSLNDVFTIDDVTDWHARRNNPELVVEEKVDGLTLAVRYDGGTFTQGATRGDGETGEDVTQNAGRIPGLPSHIDLPAGSMFYARGEVHMTDEAYQQVNALQAAAGKKLFANARNAAAGILRSGDSPYIRYLSIRMFAVLKLEYCPDDVNELHTTEAGDISLLRRLGFPAVSCAVVRTPQALTDAIQQIGTDNAAGAYGFPVDGAAVKINRKDLQTDMDTGNKYPLWAVAYKYPAEARTTVIKDIEVTLGRTGVLTPVAVLEPVSLAGTTVSRATCHNQAFLTNNKINIGARVTVIKSGEIIPKITAVLTPAEKPFQIAACPVCGAAAQPVSDPEDSNTVIMTCPNPACPGKISGYLKFFCSKHCMDIRGMGPAKIDALIVAGLVTSPASLYKLMPADFQTAGFTEATSTKLVDAIQASRGNTFEQVFAAFGIPGAGRTVGRILAERYPDMDAVASAPFDELTSIDSIGSVMAVAIMDWFHSPSTALIWKELACAGVKMTSERYLSDTSEQSDGTAFPCAGLSVCVTGAIPGYTRDSIQTYLTSIGAKPVSGVSKKTDCLLCENPNGTGSKLTSARSLNIPILTIEQFRAKYLNQD